MSFTEAIRNGTLSSKTCYRQNKTLGLFVGTVNLIFYNNQKLRPVSLLRHLVLNPQRMFESKNFLVIQINLILRPVLVNAVSRNNKNIPVIKFLTLSTGHGELNCPHYVSGENISHCEIF